jgi:hypothetical protein
MPDVDLNQDIAGEGGIIGKGGVEVGDFEKGDAWVFIGVRGHHLVDALFSEQRKKYWVGFECLEDGGFEVNQGGVLFSVRSG